LPIRALFLEISVLSDIQQQAIVECLKRLDYHTQRNHPWPGPPLLAALYDHPVPGHPDPTARGIRVTPLPAPAEIWEHADGLVAALGQVSNDLNTPDMRARLLQAPAAGIRIVAWLFMHSDITIVEEFGPQQVRFIDAVDIDDRSYVLIHLPGHATGTVTVYAPGATDDNGVIDLLRILARDLRTG
jgi:hypothetical protein